MNHLNDQILPLLLMLIWPEDVLKLSHANKQLLLASVMYKIDMRAMLQAAAHHLRKQSPETLVFTRYFACAGIVTYPQWLHCFGSKIGRTLRMFRARMLYEAHRRLLLFRSFQIFCLAALREKQIRLLHFPSNIIAAR